MIYNIYYKHNSASHNGTPEPATGPGRDDSGLRNHLSTNGKPSTTRNLENTSKATKTQNPANHPTHILTIEKTFTSTESESIPPLESTLKEMPKFSPSNCPTYRFKEWTTHEKGGLEFTLAATIPSLPPSFLFGELDDTCNNPQMIRCITANQLWKKYLITSPPGDVYQPSTGWWLLVTSLDDSSLVSPTTLLLCLENLRTIVETSDTLCFHLADFYRGKFLSQHWLQLIAIIFCRQTKICFFDRLTYTPETPISPLEALSVMHSWSYIHMGNRPCIVQYGKIAKQFLNT